MNYLMDTHALLWALFEPEKLAPKVMEIVRDPRHTIFVSAVSFWEISLKSRMGKLDFQHISPLELPNICELMKFDLLPITPEDAAGYHLLQSDFHKDPFDRMLIRQAIHHKLILISKDQMMRHYLGDGLLLTWE